MTLENHSVVIPRCARFVEGTEQSVTADNLRAQGLLGFAKNISGDYLCRLCTGQKSEIQGCSLENITLE